MKENDVNAKTEGLADILKDGSMMVEDTDNGRIVFFNFDGEIEWEFVNKADNNKVYTVSWSRIVEDKNLIKNIKQKIQNTTCKINCHKTWSQV